MTVNLSYFAGAGWQFFDDNGNPLTGGKLYTYLAGTTTPAVTYTSNTGLTANANPIVLDAAGRPTAQVWLTSGVSYKFVVKTSADVSIRTYDNLCSVNDFSTFANTTDPALGDALVGFRQSNASGNLTGAVGKTVHQKLQESVSVKDFGAVGDGTTNDRNALQAAITYATLNNVALYVPTGTYYVPNNSTSLSFTGNLTMYGDGMYNSVLYYNDSVSASARNFFVSNDCGNLAISDMSIQADWGVSANYAPNSQLTFFQASGTQSASISRCKFSGSRFMALILSNFANATVTHCVFENILADGCRIVGSNQVLIANNQFKNVGDNAIAVHTLDSQSSPAKGDVAIANNICVDTAGISCLGAKKTTITGNVVTRPYSLGIQVGQNSFATTEGSTDVLSVLIANNVITDVFQGTTFVVGGGNNGGYIKVDGFQVNDIGAGYVGNPNGSGGVLQPYPYLYTNNQTASTQNPGNYSIIIDGNVCMRTLYPTSAYSNYGFGVRIGRDGPVDPAITYSSFVEQGQIVIINSVTGLKIANNIVSGGTDFGIFLKAATGQTIVSWNSVSIENNQLFNISTNSTLNIGIYIIGKGDININGNLFDLDPYNISPFRAANGKWGSSYGNFGAIFLAESNAKILNNTFKNTGSIFLGASPANDAIWIKNTLACNPFDDGASADNVGVRYINEGAGRFDATVIIEDGDPSSATFNTVLNVCQTSSSTIPTTGKYLKGLFVQNPSKSILGTAASQYVVQGWLRLTTGSAHVLNTDWAEVRTLTGT